MQEKWQLNNIDQKLIDLALEEDLGSPFLDVTTKTIFPGQSHAQQVEIISKSNDEIVICGLMLIPAIFKRFNAPIELKPTLRDGNILLPGEKLLTLSSDASVILMTERTLLNFLRHLSAIATLTKKFVDMIAKFNTKILDTRKTTPGQRHLEKYAVHCGGGVNHRMGLYDAFMVKDTHIDLAGGMKNALQKIPNKAQKLLPVIVEVRPLEELKTVVNLGRDKVTRVLLDNMTLDELRQSVSLCKNIFETESSGNINLETIVNIAKTGVDYASVGMLTYAAGQVDLSMKGIK